MYVCMYLVCSLAAAAASQRQSVHNSLQFRSSRPIFDTRQSLYIIFLHSIAAALGQVNLRLPESKRRDRSQKIETPEWILPSVEHCGSTGSKERYISMIVIIVGGWSVPFEFPF